jgi:hypothetical protein
MRQGRTLAGASAALLLSMTCALSASAAPTTSLSVHRLYLSFADGSVPASAGLCAGRPAPAFRCAGSDCAARKRKLRSAVQKLYAPFDLEVTLEPPSEPHLTIVISSEDGAWCKPDYRPAVQGIAPINCAGDGHWGLQGYVFSCDDVQKCAVRAAQESAHLLGLDHSANRSDVMYPMETDGRARFLDSDSKTSSPFCRKASQNSYALLAARLGPAHSRHPHQKEHQ